eukprot:5015186-Pyramimonas_sp.AAC.1
MPHQDHGMCEARRGDGLLLGCCWDTEVWERARHLYDRQVETLVYELDGGDTVLRVVLENFFQDELFREHTAQ